MTKELTTLRVAGTSSISSVAGAIAKFIREDGIVVVQSVGNAALLRATRAVALATQYMMEEGVRIAASIDFFDIPNSDPEITHVVGIRFVVGILLTVSNITITSEGGDSPMPGQSNPRLN